MPGLQRLAHLQGNAAVMDPAERGKPEFELGEIPFRRKIVAGALQLGEHVQEIFPEEMRQHETVMQRGAPAHEFTLLRLAPEFCDQRADQQLLGERHARVRRHFERPEFNQPEPASRAIRRIEFVDADFGAVGIAGDVDEDVAEQPIDQP